VHVMRQVASRQLSDANFQWFLPALLKYSTKCWLFVDSKLKSRSTKKQKANSGSPLH